jgi:hypothetical protein
MKCSVLQRQLLELERPDHPPIELLTHLARCPACRAWQRHLLQLETDVRQLPMPASTTRDDFLRRLLIGTSASTPGPEPIPELAPPPDLPTPERGTLPLRSFRPPLGRRERGVRKLALATGLAAGLLLFVLGWTAWLLPTNPLDTKQANSKQPAPDPLLAALVKHNLHLAATAKPRERVETLAALAEELHGEMRSLAHAGTAEDLKTLAALYEKVVRQGVLEQAGRLPAGQRQQVLKPIAGRLSLVSNEAEQLATEVAADRVEALQSMAKAARDVKEKLLALAKEEALS